MGYNTRCQALDKSDEKPNLCTMGIRNGQRRTVLGRELSRYSEKEFGKRVGSLASALRQAGVGGDRYPENRNVTGYSLMKGRLKNEIFNHTQMMS